MAAEEFKNALKSADEVEITVTGRKSGRKISHPVWFAEEGEKLELLPVKGSDSDWYKNVLKTPDIHLSVKGREWTAKATPITDPARVQRIVEKFRAKYGADQVKQYYTKFDVAVEVPLT
jgi:deazaflavin-dependent oxidoreductase (nitroreductase family)